MLCSLAGLSVAATVSLTICSAECWAETVADATLHQPVVIHLPHIAVETAFQTMYDLAADSFQDYVVEALVVAPMRMLAAVVMHLLGIAAIQVAVAD